MDFKERLANTRKIRGLSQESLADKLGVSRQAVSKWETGDAQPDYQKLVALADVLDVSMDYLCCRTDDVEKAEKNNKNIIFAILIVTVAVISLYIGTFFGGHKEVVPEKMGLPDTIEIAGVNFSSGRKWFFYHFVPSVIRDDLTYKIVFCDYEGNETAYEVTCNEGTCNGRADLKGSYTSVVVVISDGEESRALPIAQGLNISENHVSWTPITE